MNSTFVQNYAGQYGSAINIENILASQVEIKQINFANNTGAYSMFESEHALPFFELLSLRKYMLNFMQLPTQTGFEQNCTSELHQIMDSVCLKSWLYLSLEGKMWLISK